MLKGIRIPVFALVLATFGSLAAAAQSSAELLARFKAMEDRIKALEAEVQELKGQQAATTAALTAAAPATPTPAPAVALAETATSQTPQALGGAGGPAATLATGFKAAIDVLGSKHGTMEGMH